jgi:quercetin dioxygenase-like cupin family protein
MRTLWLVLLFFSCGVLRAQAPEIPAAKLPGEPHHHLRIDNEFVRAYYVEVAPHDETQLHQHDHDYIYVSLGPADVVNAVLNKPDVHLLLKNGETRFTHGGFAHVARNLSDAPFRNITIELLKASGEPRNLCAQIVPNLASVGCDKTTAAAQGGHGFSVEPQLEVDTMRLDLVRLDPETESAGVALEADSLLVPLDGSDLQIQVKGEPPKILRGGELAWIGKNVNGGVWNPGKNPASYLQFKFISKF